MKVQFITDGDNYEALYIDGVKKCESHSLQAWEVAEAILGPDNVTNVNLWNDYNDEQYTFDDDGNSFVNGTLVWKNGEGFVNQWPFVVGE